MIVALVVNVVVRFPSVLLVNIFVVTVVVTAVEGSSCCCNSSTGSSNSRDSSGMIEAPV